MEEQLRYYMAKGYQIAFDLNGIRAWHLAAYGAPLVYAGDNVSELFNSLNAHYPTTLATEAV